MSDIVEKAGVVDTRFDAPPSSHAVVGLYCYPPDVFDVIATLEPSRRGELEITDVNRHYAPRAASTPRGRRLVGGRGQALAAPRRHRPADRGDGREQAGPRVIDGVARIPLRRIEDERGWFCELRRDSVLPKPMRADERLVLSCGRRPRAPLPRARPGRPLRVPPGDGARRRTRPGDGRAFIEDIGEENPVAIYVPGHHAHGFEALTDILFCYHVTGEYDPDDPDEHTVPWNDPRVAHLWSTSTPILSDAGRRRRVLITGARRAARPRARAGVRRRRRPRAHPRRLGRRRPAGVPWGDDSISCCTRPRGRTSTARRPTRRAPLR